ncbi:MAG: hypothetical protein JW952_01230 [Candidatus Eisenbacteria bacterium]|nr:hypothetical protein [Candidatus Eisenbacteria bacterium]
MVGKEVVPPLGTSPDPGRKATLAGDLRLARGSRLACCAAKLAAALFLVFLAVAAPAAPEVVTTIADWPGDDHGPGTYTYPTNGVFAAGSFDMTEFRVEVEGNRVYFAVDLNATLDDPWGSGAGFSLQSIDIYVDKDGVPGSGATWVLDGRNARMSPVNSWDVAVWCAPPFDDFQSRIVFPDGEFDTTQVRTSVSQAEGRITVSAPKSAVGTPTSSWRYVVLMLGQNGYETGRVRQVRAVNSEWDFGGGTDGTSDSNIMDVITVPGLSQEGMLGTYDPATSQVCALFAQPDSVAPVISHEPVTTAEAHLPVPVFATVVDSFVERAALRYRPAGDPGFTTVELVRAGMTGWSGEIPGDAVAQGTIEYFLYATDGLFAACLPADTLSPFVVTVQPDASPPDLYEAAARPATFYPDGDGYRDSTEIAWRLTEACFVTAAVRSGGQTVRILCDSVLFAAGECSAWWNGRDDGGQYVPQAAYTVLLEGTDLAGLVAEPETVQVTVGGAAPPRKTDAVFLFHLNQNLVPYAKVASTACYVGLLETLRAHPSLKFMIHVSGCLLHSLLWMDDTAIELIREGLADGQFEIVGSTYAQNIMYSTRTDSTDFQFNDAQIKAHRKLIESVFGASPVSFWNPERVWTQNFVRLLADNGYDNVQVEDHILYDSGITESEYLVRTTSCDGRTLNVFDDDKSFQGTVNYAVDSGDYQSVLSFLHDRYNEDSGDEFAVCYHEDAEATGLWDYEGGENPQVDWSHLDDLLTALESDPLINVTTYSDFMESHGSAASVSRVVDGAADWMGRSAWFAENAGATGTSYRAFFDEIRDTLNAVRAEMASAAGDTLAASKLLDHAWFDLVAHQYEFLVHGEDGHDGYTDWDMARAAYVAARAAREALLGEDRQYAADLNDDGVTEVAVVKDGTMLVFSTKGGKLLYWFDLVRGTEEVGGENSMYYGELFQDEADYVPRLLGGRDVYPWLSGNGIFPQVFDWEFELRRRAFEDSLRADGTYLGELRESAFTPALREAGADFTFSDDDLTFTKSYWLSQDALDVTYSLLNKKPYARSFEIHVESAFSPSCLEAMDGGVAALRYWNGADTSSSVAPGVKGVVNVATGHSLEYDFVTEPSRLYGEEAVFGLELSPVYDLTVPAQALSALSLRVKRLTGSVGVPPRAAPVPAASIMGKCAPNPFTAGVTVGFTVGRVGPSEPGATAAAAGVGSGPDAAGATQSSRPVSLKVFDVHSRFVRTVWDGALAPGTHECSWDGRDWKGRPVRPGIYFLRLEDGGSVATAKVVRVE